MLAADHLADSADTISLEVSPRRPDLIGLLQIRDLLADMGKVNQETGEPLDDGRVSQLTSRSDFPDPALGSARSKNRLWRRREVVAWALTWEQKPGRPRKQPEGES